MPVAFSSQNLLGIYLGWIPDTVVQPSTNKHGLT
jgi:hypothetical protein